MTKTKKTLTLTQLSEYIGKDKRTLYRMIKDGRFPVEPIKGTDPRLWSHESVDEWRLNGGEFDR